MIFLSKNFIQKDIANASKGWIDANQSGHDLKKKKKKKRKKRTADAPTYNNNSSPIATKTRAKLLQQCLQLRKSPGVGSY